MDDFQLMKLQHEEHDAWLQLVEQLRSVGAVTERDCQSSPMERNSPGLLVFHLIRSWAHRYADLREVLPTVKNNEAIDN